MTDYDPVAAAFIEARSPTVGVETVLDWARSLPDGGSVLDLGCGHGMPMARALSEAGFHVHGVDTSPRLLEAFRENVPGATAEQADAVTLELEPRSFDGVMAWGLLFLLEPGEQEAVIDRAARALKPGGHVLMTAPTEVAEWRDNLTGARSVSLGGERYRALFAEAGLRITSEVTDEGGNHYWLTTKATDRTG